MVKISCWMVGKCVGGERLQAADGGFVYERNMEGVEPPTNHTYHLESCVVGLTADIRETGGQYVLSAASHKSITRRNLLRW